MNLRLRLNSTIQLDKALRADLPIQPVKMSELREKMAFS